MAEWAGISSETAYPYHEKIDNLFGTQFASSFTPEALENQPEVTEGILPPPGGNLTTTTKRIAAIASSTGVATSAAAVGSALTQTSALPNGMSIERLTEAGKADDRGGLTRAGRGLQKHGGRSDTVFPFPSGSVSEINTHGQEVLENILSHPNKTITVSNTDRYGIIIDIHAPGIGGVRYDNNGNFIGFLQPPQG
ncbi:MAG: hypothetical protein KDK76_06775 [Chlamydiia bacterium]|nr:hypothetical protein [Chlamydiia bacterium]